MEWIPISGIVTLLTCVLLEIAKRVGYKRGYEAGYLARRIDEEAARDWKRAEGIYPKVQL